MNKCRAIASVIVLLSAFQAFAQESLKPVFKHGETLHFNIKYLGLTGGKMAFTANEEFLNGKDVFHVKIAARTTGLVDNLFGIHDILESYFDKNTGLPEKSIRNISEGRYKAYDEIDFFHDEHYIVSQKNGLIDVPEDIHDFVSAIYYLRRMDFNTLEAGNVVTFQVYFENEQFPMRVIYKGKERLKVRSKVYMTHKFVPILRPGKLFSNKEAMVISFSDDLNKIPVNVCINFKVGAFKFELEDCQNLLHPFDALVEK
jgi:hypothetical protein